MKKLIFVNCLKNMHDESLAKQIYSEQVRRSWPGLAKEASELCLILGLPNIVKEEVGSKKWETMVKNAVKEFHERKMKEEVGSKTKLEDIKHENVKLKEYFRGKNLTDTRLMFRIRSRMIQLKANFKNNPRYKKDGWKCDGCEMEVESDAHVIKCVAYEQVRDGKDLNCDKDLVQYYKEVMKIRMRKSKL